jgi:anti-anti-sigma factor
MAVAKRARTLRLVPRREPPDGDLPSEPIDLPADVDVVRDRHVTVIAPKRDLTGAFAGRVGRVVDRTLTDERNRVLFDLAAVQYLDSSGLAVIVDAMKQARARGGDVAVCGLHPDVRAIFELTRLSAVIEIHPFREEALAAWA